MSEQSQIDLFFLESNLVLKYDSKGKKEQIKLNFQFELQRWYFICITHEYRFLGRR